MSDKRVLVVEDEIHIQRLISMLLERKGYTVVTASNGEEALKGLNEGELPDIIILDIMMPGIDGMHVLRSIKGDSRMKHIPVVMLTALAQENIIIQGAKLGIKDYIRKPFHPNAFVERIEKLLERPEKAAG